MDIVSILYSAVIFNSKKRKAFILPLILKAQSEKKKSKKPVHMQNKKCIFLIQLIVITHYGAAPYGSK